MKETRTCAICPQEFKVRTTSIRKTCSTECSRKYSEQWRREYLQRPEIKERKKEYYQRPEVKEKKKQYNKEYYQRPEVKERAREYHKRRGEKQ